MKSCSNVSFEKYWRASAQTSAYLVSPNSSTVVPLSLRLGLARPRKRLCPSTPQAPAPEECSLRAAQTASVLSTSSTVSSHTWGRRARARSARGLKPPPRSQEPGAWTPPTLLTGATGRLGRPGQRAVAPTRRHGGIIKAALSTCCGADSARTFSGSSSISMHLA